MHDITVEVTALPKANLSLIQNRIPLIENIRILNESGEDRGELTLEIFSNPSEAVKGSHTIALIRGGESYDLERPRLSHSWEFFAGCSEEIPGTVTVRISQGEEILCEKIVDMRFTSRSIWLGMETPVELLCSYITPNSSGVQSTIRSAAKILEKKSGSGALDGYQSGDKGRVYNIVQSVYLAVRKANIAYAEPPRSFQLLGQKVRSANEILSHQLGTCLDLALFFASCLEQCGLNAVIFLVRGHAFTGVWLDDRNLPRASDEDGQFFRKRVDLQELLVFETTTVTSQKLIPFSEAEALAKSHLQYEGAFHCGIDVEYCRRSAKIYPLNEMNPPEESAPQEKERREWVRLEKREFKEFTLPEEKVSRRSELEMWQDKLLDLTFRNRLLNFRTTNSTVKIECSNPAEIEDLLADGSVFEMLPNPQSRADALRSDAAEVFIQKVLEGFGRKRLFTNLPELSFHQVLKKLFRDIRTVQEETGANTLYLSLGILEWHEDDRGKVRHSPLILLPVELKKRAVGNRYSIVHRDDETVLNYTLLQKLSRDYGLTFPGLDPIPQDDSGVDVELIFNTIRAVVADKRGWELKEEVWLSEFTFQKYLMWKELAEQFPAMMESPVVARIMGERKESEEMKFVSEDRIDSYPLEEIYCPLSADSSQLAAIFSANEGKSFVLQGPPGSGKSQTITNMISHCLAHGKSVLFVSEKRVALDVVYKRLKSVGLESSCLELHSKKSEKRAMIQSFYDALEAKGVGRSGEWHEVAEALQNIRGGLNSYFRELHDRSAGGISAYDAFAKANRGETISRIDFNPDALSQLTQEQVNDTLRKIERWQSMGASLTDEEYRAWKFCGSSHWSPGGEDALKRALEEMLENREKRGDILKQCGEFLPFSEEWSEREFGKFGEMVSLFLEPFDMKFSFLGSQNWPGDRDSLLAALESMSEYEGKMGELSAICDPAILQENIPEMRGLYRKSREGFFLSRWIAGFKLRGILKRYAKTKTESSKIVLQAGALHDRADQNRSDNTLWKEWFHSDFSGDKKEEYSEEIHRADSFVQNFSSLFGKSIALLSQGRSAFLALAENRSMFLAEGSQNYRSLQEFTAVVADQERRMDLLCDQYGMAGSLFEQEPELTGGAVKEMSRSISKFRDLCGMNELRNSVSSLAAPDGTAAGFSALFEAVDSGSIDRSDLVTPFEFNFYTHWLAKRLDSSEILTQLSGKQLTIKDREYRETYERYQREVQKALIAKVTGNKPVINSDILPSSPLGTIMKESKKSRRHLPIRKFLETIKPVVKDLKPCFLMSPMSVSQYLDVAPDFDIVIFDEASQIQPWDAIGSMARGKQAIVVGDSKQLPPTSFFSVNGEELDDEKIDCESVLEMFGTLYPEMLLKWHYRSQSESLISFSNYHIYGNRLHTFPSANTNDQAVTLEVVTGEDAFYDRGKTKTNRREAIAVVQELFTRLGSAGTNSIGVVTFSTPQATLIEDLIDEEINRSPQFAPYFDPAGEEYVFVKNLESVQGDERDVILFSIGYGKDKNGVINRNFGPLNNSGGERRLNVAVTRARREVKIFSNFRAGEFNTGSSKSEGLALLREYLAFAESGHRALFAKSEDAPERFGDNLFEQELAAALENLGWKIHARVGVGGYRMDLAVVHPENPDRFLAGIECDGARYFSANSARDRDILRKSVLEGLGWNLIRLWSTDWWYDRSRVLEELDLELKELMTVPAVQEEVQESSWVPAEECDECEVQECDECDESNENWYDLSAVKIVPQGEFYSSRSLVKDQIDEIVERLAPISKEECFTLIRKGWGFARGGSKFKTYLEECSSHIHTTEAKDLHCFWKSPEQPREISVMRCAKSGEKRHPRTVSPEELTCGIVPIIELNRQVESGELYRIIAKKLGYSSVSPEIVQELESIVASLVEDKRVQVNGELISIVE